MEHAFRASTADGESPRPVTEEFVMGSFTLILLVAWAVVARF